MKELIEWIWNLPAFWFAALFILPIALYALHAYYWRVVRFRAMEAEHDAHRKQVMERVAKERADMERRQSLTITKHS